MLRKINSFSSLFVLFALLSGCYSEEIPTAYLPRPREVKTQVTGSWVSINYHSPQDRNYSKKISGELIALQTDSIYVLNEFQLFAVDMNTIDTAMLYIFKNQTGKYILTTVIMLVPNIIAAVANKIPEYLIFVIPWAVTGTITSLIEGSGHKDRLTYPKRNSLEDFRKFARFPMGIPPDMKRNELTLLTLKLKPIE
jgi:hypothetical protein